MPYKNPVQMWEKNRSLPLDPMGMGTFQRVKSRYDRGGCGESSLPTFLSGQQNCLTIGKNVANNNKNKKTVNGAVRIGNLFSLIFCEISRLFV